jgi:hypothetical protein
LSVLFPPMLGFKPVTITRPVGDKVLDVLRGWGFVAVTGSTEFIFKVPDGSDVLVIHTVRPAATRWPAKTKMEK